MSLEQHTSKPQPAGSRPSDRPVADTEARTWVARSPASWRPYLRLARYDRPVGFWLLAAPCWIGMALARLDAAWEAQHLIMAVAFGIGAIAMRGAGCTYNDIVDRDLDAQVARTADRPLAAGTVSVRAAWLFLAAQALVGLGVLLILPTTAQIVALAALPLVAAYPFMKRITWWPQVWLGLTFNWGVLVGFAAAGGWFWFAAGAVYIGLACWTVGYDTIYARQDVEDDALVGVKSTARRFGARVRAGVTTFYAIAGVAVAVGLVMGALSASFQLDITRRAALTGACVGAALFIGVLVVQLARVRFDDPRSCLIWFKANQWIGLALAAALAGVPPLMHGLAPM